MKRAPITDDWQASHTTPAWVSHSYGARDAEYTLVDDDVIVRCCVEHRQLHGGPSAWRQEVVYEFHEYVAWAGVSEGSTSAVGALWRMTLLGDPGVLTLTARRSDEVGRQERGIRYQQRS